MLLLYTVKRIRGMIDKLIQKQGTSDPDALLLSKKNVTFKYLPMTGNINGMYSYISSKKQILSVNDYLQGFERQYASFHELGHVECKHKGKLLLNCPSINYIKEEYEADLFSTYMMIKHHGITKENIDEFVLPRRVSELIHKFLK
jgi:Zn-dependent peptidase ImmA (M78 family)